MHQAPVTCLAFLDPFPILLSTDAAGYLALWALPPARMGLRCVALYLETFCCYTYACLPPIYFIFLDASSLRPTYVLRA